jgi:hypothetical protein
MAGRQRLGIGHVQRRAQPPAGQLRDQRLRVDDDAAGGVDQQGAVLHRGQEGGVDHARGLRGHRHDQDDHVRLGQEFRQVGRGPHTLPGRPCDVGQLDVEAGQHPPDRRADVPGADDQHPRADHRGVRGERPAARVLLPDEERDAALGGEGHGDGPLGGGRRVRAAGVAEDDAVGQPADELLRPRTEQLHELQPRQGVQEAVVRDHGTVAPRHPDLRLSGLAHRRALVGVDAVRPDPG